LHDEEANIGQQKKKDFKSPLTGSEEGGWGVFWDAVDAMINREKARSYQEQKKDHLVDSKTKETCLWCTHLGVIVLWGLDSVKCLSACRAQVVNGLWGLNKIQKKSRKKKILKILIQYFPHGSLCHI